MLNYIKKNNIIFFVFSIILLVIIIILIIFDYFIFGKHIENVTHAIIHNTEMFLLVVILISGLFFLKKIVSQKKENENVLINILSTIPEGVTILNTKGQIIYANSIAEKILRLRKEEIENRYFNDINWKITDIDGNPFPEEQLPFIRVMKEQKQIYNIIHCIEDNEGNRIILSINSAPLFKNNKIDGVLAIISDITEKKLNEIKLIESEEKYRNIVEKSPWGMHFYKLDKNNNLIFEGANETAEKILKINHKELINKTITEAFPGLAKTNIPDEYKKVATEGTIFETENIYYDFDKIVGAFQVTAFQTIKNSMVASFVDITERKIKEQQIKKLNNDLIEKNQELEQIIYVASHDLRSPLVNINGFNKELENSIKEMQQIISQCNDKNLIDNLKPYFNVDFPESFSYIKKSIEKMDLLLNSILNVSRVGKMQPNFEIVDVDTIVSNCLKNFDIKINENNIKITVESLPKCYSDKFMLDIIFSNLIENAIKYRRKDIESYIKIYGYTKDDFSIYCIEDNGIGISKEYFEKIFSLFYRINNDNNKGEGIGLTICKKIINRLNGKIWVESEKNNWTKFFISLPCKKLG